MYVMYKYNKYMLSPPLIFSLRSAPQILLAPLFLKFLLELKPVPTWAYGVRKDKVLLQKREKKKKPSAWLGGDWQEDG